MDKIGAARTAYQTGGWLGSDAYGIIALGVAIYMLAKSGRRPFLKRNKKIAPAPHSAHPRPPHRR